MITSSTWGTSLIPDFDENDKVARAISHRITDDGRTSDKVRPVSVNELYEPYSGI
jgi:hypothetical protein